MLDEGGLKNLFGVSSHVEERNEQPYSSRYCFSIVYSVKEVSIQSIIDTVV